MVPLRFAPASQARPSQAEAPGWPTRPIHVALGVERPETEGGENKRQLSKGKARQGKAAAQPGSRSSQVSAEAERVEEGRRAGVLGPLCAPGMARERRQGELSGALAPRSCQESLVPGWPAGWLAAKAAGVRHGVRRKQDAFLPRRLGVGCHAGSAAQREASQQGCSF